LEKHIDTVGRRKLASNLHREIEDFSDDYADDEAYEVETGEVVSAVSQALSPISTEEKALLRELSEFAAKSTQRPDCKAQTLIDWIKTTLQTGGQWNDERVIIFTEYRATQKWLFDLLAREGLAADGRLEMIFGGMMNDLREPIRRRFNPKKNPVRILWPPTPQKGTIKTTAQSLFTLRFRGTRIAWTAMAVLIVM
jgi:hypothetical protein